MKVKYAAYLIVVMLAGLVPVLASEQPQGTVIRAIQVVANGAVTHVMVDADGPLPLPQADSLTNPPRIYFDLAGVNYKIKETTAAQKGGAVTRVRVGLRPEKATRVVLDLTRLENYRVIADDHQAGRIRVLIGPESAIDLLTTKSPAMKSPVPAGPAPSPSAPSSPSAPVAPPRIAEPPSRPAPAPVPTPAASNSSSTAAPARPPAIAPSTPARRPVLSPEAPRPALPAGDVVVYRKQIYGELSRMEQLRVLIARIDATENIAADILVPAAQEFTEIRRSLEALQPSAQMAVTHDLLMTSCTFGAIAARLAIDAARDSNLETRGRAASAAAGSMMLFDRACADLGCAKPPR